MNWIPIPFPISIQFTLPTVHTVEGFLSTFIHAAKSNVSWCTSHSTTECPWLSSINKAVKWVLSRHPISKMTIFPEGLVHKVLLNPNREHFIKGLLIVTDTSKNLKYTFQNSHVSISSQLLWSVFPSSMKIWLFWIWAEKKKKKKKNFLRYEGYYILWKRLTYFQRSFLHVTPRQIAETAYCLWIENFPLTVPIFFCVPRIVLNSLIVV